MSARALVVQLTQPPQGCPLGRGCPLPDRVTIVMRQPRTTNANSGSLEARFSLEIKLIAAVYSNPHFLGVSENGAKKFTHPGREPLAHQGGILVRRRTKHDPEDGFRICRYV